MASRDPFADPEPLIRRVYAYVAYRVGDGPDAEDVTSATFERALRIEIASTRVRGNAAAWLIGIARRQISDHFGGSPLVTDVRDQLAAGELESDSAERIDLRRAVGSLNERDRELIALRYGADLTARRSANSSICSTNSVEVALHRALQTLRAALSRR